MAVCVCRLVAGRTTGCRTVIAKDAEQLRAHDFNMFLYNIKFYIL